MRIDAITIWAAIATCLAMTLAGVVIAQSNELNRLTQVNVSATGPQASEPGGAIADANPYQVPQWLVGAPKEWRSDVNEKQQGYAILFDYDSRKLLVEHCVHPGLFDAKTNLPVEQVFACDRVLTGKIQQFNQGGLVATRKDGSSLNVNVAGKTKNDQVMLALNFDNHKMALIPGQTNDLLQQILATPKMQAQKVQMAQYSEQKFLQGRALIESKRAVPSGEDNFPRTKLSKAAMEKIEEARRADLTAHQ